MPDCDLTFACMSENMHSIGCPWEPDSPAQTMTVREWELMLSGLSGPRTTLPGAGRMLRG